jgi:hypothetical protein
MKLGNDRKETDKTGAARRRPRFRLDKLEERIAPAGMKNGWYKNTKPTAPSCACSDESYNCSSY